MNNERRKRLQEDVLPLIATARAHLEEISSDEANAVANLPDGISESERGQAMQEVAYALDEAVTSLEELESELERCIE